MEKDQTAAIVAVALIASSLLLMGAGAAVWYGAFHLGASDRLVGGCLIAAGVFDALLSLFFMNRSR